MAPKGKRARHLQLARNTKKLKSFEDDELSGETHNNEMDDDEESHSCWKELELDDEEVEDWREEETDMTSDEEGEPEAKDVYEQLLQNARSTNHEYHPYYSRGVTYSDRHERRRRAEAEELKKIASGSQKITTFFMKDNGEAKVAREPSPPNEVREIESRSKAIRDLEKFLKSEECPQGTTEKRYRGVLELLQMTQSREPEETREKICMAVSRSLGMKQRFARNLPSWERMWIENRHIEEDSRGKHRKMWSWFNDEEVQLVVRQAIDQHKESKCSSYWKQDYCLFYILTRTRRNHWS